MREYSILHALYFSFFSRDFYRDAAKNWKGITFLYLLILIALSNLPNLVHMATGYYEFSKDIAPPVINQVPPITIKDGKAVIDAQMPYKITDPETGKTFVTIDTTGKIKTLEEAKSVALLTQTEFIASKNKFESRIIKLSSIKKLDINQDILKKWLRLAVFAIPALYIFNIVLSFVGKLILALFYSLIGLFIAKSRNIALTFYSVLSVTICALTPAVILKALLNQIPVHIPATGWIFVLISMAYMAFGIFANSNDSAGSEYMDQTESADTDESSTDDDPSN